MEENNCNLVSLSYIIRLILNIYKSSSLKLIKADPPLS